jgi:acetyl esterase/lipase
MPTFASVNYGTHERQVLDFYKATSDKPTPVVLYIHGGGWQNGNKDGAAGFAKKYLDAGISVAAINYRYTKNGKEMNVDPPVKAPLDDAARALQFVRSKAAEWNIDKKRIGATGGSAGACSSLWLAFHNDMADPKSDDPIARESTRLYCAAVNGAQVSLDPKELREWIPNYTYGAHAFGLADFKALQDNREKVLKHIKEYSPIEHVSKDDPPIFMEYPSQKVPPVLGEKQADPTHSAVMGLKLAEKLKEVGVEVILVYPGQTHPQYKNSADFLIDRLRK